ncbi:MAG: hypothetical protein IH965_14495, partial [Gemmatimonadetes bacterium]|nr:hypothetical protein [Gemmatimonadota bacterium]
MSDTFETVTFSLDALKRCLMHQLPPKWYRTYEVPPDGSWGVLRIVRGEHCFLLDERAATPRARVVIGLNGTGFFGKLRKPGYQAALQRVHRIGVQASRHQLAFPRAWSQYNVHNYVTVFAYQLHIGDERLIAEVITDGAADVYMCVVTTQDAQVDLTGFVSDRRPYEGAISQYDAAAAEVSSQFETLQRPKQMGVIDLDAVGFGAVTGGRHYSAWLPLLTDEQRRFLESPSNRSLKLRGPAGSGKTL